MVANAGNINASSCTELMVAARGVGCINSTTTSEDNRKRKLDAITTAAGVGSTKPRPSCGPVVDSTHPLVFLKLILSVVPEGKALLLNHKQSISFRKPSKDEIDSYDMEVVGAVRSGSVEKLREIMDKGRKALTACNRFGESLIHMACRRGKTDVVRFLLKEGSARTDIRDDYGRTPAHDACWTAEANIDVMDELLQHIPIAMLLAEDVRGFTPFQYARREHWPIWIDYLKDRRLVLLERLVMDLETKPLAVDAEE